MQTSLNDSLMLGLAYSFFPSWYESAPYPRSRPPDPLEGVNIYQEFQLVIRKMSKLSASQRREIVRRYHKAKDPT